MAFFRRCWVTGNPQLGQGQLSVFVPHLGQVMVMSPFYVNNPFSSRKPFLCNHIRA